MTDYTSNLGASRAPGQRETAIIEEGAITITTGLDGTGRERTIYVGAAGLAQGDPVAIVNSSENTYTATNGNILVERPQNGEGLVIGSLFEVNGNLKKNPATATAANTLANRLTGNYHRLGAVELCIPGTIKKITIACDGTHPIVPGVGTTIELDMTKSLAAHKMIYTAAASGGTGIIPLHYVPAGSSGDLYNILAIFTGLQTSVTGS
jgi:hypothetical protein